MVNVSKRIILRSTGAAAAYRLVHFGKAAAL